jgi:hypothetical protein
VSATDVSGGEVGSVVGVVVMGVGGETVPANVSLGSALPPGCVLGGVGSNWCVQPTPASQISGHACASKFVTEYRPVVGSSSPGV